MRVRILKNNILTHVLAAITVAVGIWLVFSGDNKRSSILPGGSENSSVATSRIFSSGNKDAQGESIVSESYEKPQHKELRTNPVPLKIPSSKTQRSAQISHHLVDNPEQAVSQYIAALRNSDGVNSARLWSVVSQCEACLLLLVDMIINDDRSGPQLQ